MFKTILLVLILLVSLLTLFIVINNNQENKLDVPTQFTPAGGPPPAQSLVSPSSHDEPKEKPENESASVQSQELAEEKADGAEERDINEGIEFMGAVRKQYLKGTNRKG
jgi:hypothetical protein